MTTPDFNRAYLLARLSSIVYLTDLNAISDGVAHLGLEFVRLFTAPGFQALIARNEAGEQFIVYRGTPVTCGRDIWDAIVALGYDVSTKHVRVGPGLVLTGVYHAVQAQWADMWALIDPTKPVFIGGHSLGAAMALVAAANVSRAVDLTVIVFAPFQCADANFWRAVFGGRRGPLIFGNELDFAPGWDHLDTITCLAAVICHLVGTGWEMVTEWPWIDESVPDHDVTNYVAKTGALAGQLVEA